MWRETIRERGGVCLFFDYFLTTDDTAASSEPTRHFDFLIFKFKVQVVNKLCARIT
jgi:hypothetical protein